MKYQDAKTPKHYRCSVCGAKQVKLWRQYQTVADAIELHCCTCAAKDQDRDISDIDQDGLYTGSYEMRSDQIGGLVPAIPTEDGRTYWGYTSVPSLGILWWKGLPTKPGAASTGPAGVDMLVRSVQENLDVIEQLSPITKTICPDVVEAVQRLAKLARERTP